MKRFDGSQKDEPPGDPSDTTPSGKPTMDFFRAFGGDSLIPPGKDRWLATPMYWFIMAPYKSPPNLGVAPSTFTTVYFSPPFGVEFPTARNVWWPFALITDGFFVAEQKFRVLFPHPKKNPQICSLKSVVQKHRCCFCFSQNLRWR